MAIIKPKMSTSYKVIFILSIFMIFFVLVAGAVTNSKSSGFGMWIWGYTSWLMYKRRNADLVAFFKILLWFYVIAACISIAILSFADAEVASVIGYNVIEAFVLFAFVILITYGLYRYFFNLEFSQNHANLSNISETAIWDQVSDELKFGKRIDSLWTRAFSESDGDSNKANARYIKLRFDQLKLDALRSSSSSSLPKESIKIKLNFFDFLNNFNMIGKLALVGILALIAYGILGGNMDPYYQATPSSKSVANHSNYDSCVAFLVDKNANNKLSETQTYCQSLYPKIPKLANSGFVSLTCLDSNGKTFYNFTVNDRDVRLSAMSNVSFIIKSRSVNGLYFESESVEKNTNRPVYIFGVIDPNNANGSMTVQYKDKNSNDYVYEFTCSESN